ncbi:hypothetical protein ND748_03065 [Frankia sp. AiPs1]|uniref:hypothetical protein n=1 Tax=Frankia sp. AiPs1 TaxID=573493 RepID=UPI002044C250|nr:hypothetical protein [Frankia sp. AiPs1]MCM3920657.1 hypothetical protein [Frankia sp. AiPs1]
MSRGESALFAVVEQTACGPVIQGGFYSSVEADLWGSKNIDGPYTVGPMYLPATALHRAQNKQAGQPATSAHLPEAVLRVLSRRPGSAA